jgi:UDP-N-acetylglucosamine diphosphorylase / glucose-1-phosphate thymidylyltransferase / UDP-N-acetylgalactosamine diphosphorylase / glucosamine-1-phosphate N-acetyltransferase / galactosamine-1-phosphate N-acetyltransferase
VKMKAVILCAGKSTRTYPLTLTRPKALIPIMNKELIFHLLEELEGLVDEVILIVGHMSNMIKEKVGDEFNGIKITYFSQEEQLGTGHAIFCAKENLKGKFLVLNGDNLYHRNDLKKLVLHEFAILINHVENPKIFGIVNTKENLVESIEEKPENPKSNMANTGAYVFDDRIFEHELVETKRGEFEITDYVNFLIENFDVNFEVVKNYWISVGYSWDVIFANEIFIEKIEKSEIKGVVEEGAVIKGEIILGKNSVIKSGVYIEGPVVIGENCIIGPNCYIRKGCVIGNNCKIGNACEIKNSTFFDNVNVKHLSYVGDSVLGEGVNFGAGTIIANFRFDGGGIKSLSGRELIDTGRRKFGAIIGDNVKTGLHTSVLPGRKIWPNVQTYPGDIVKKDIFWDE